MGVGAVCETLKLGPGCLALAALSAAVIATPVRANPDQPPPGATVPAFTGPRLCHYGTGVEFELRALDDPQNPYRGQYSDYDRWVWEHWVGPLSRDEMTYFWGKDSPEAQAFRATYPAGWRVEFAGCTPEGWLLPCSVEGLSLYLAGRGGRSLREMVADIGAGPRAAGRSVYSVNAAGVLPPELAEVREQDKLRATASKAPPIPAWLGEHPPLRTIFAPNGDVLTLGPLDLHIEGQEGGGASWIVEAEAEKWYRYDRDGRLLGSADCGHSTWDGWRALYGVDTSALLAANAGSSITQSSFGRYKVVAAVRRPSGASSAEPPKLEILGAFDFDGQPVDPDRPIPDEELDDCMGYEQKSLASIYAAQLAVGATSPESASPYWGRPEGPVAVDPAPRPRRRFARSVYGPDAPLVELKPLEDMANPNAGRYSAVDRWVFENCGSQYMTFPGHTGAAMADEYAAGKDGYQIGVEAYCDPRGYLIPLAERCEWLETLGLAAPPAPGTEARELPRFWSSGEMPAPVWDEYCEDMWKRGLASLPTVPQWLLELDLVSVVFLPDGRVLALPSPPGEAQMPFGITGAREWLLYASDGTELRREELSTIFNWGEFFDPGYSQKVEEARRQGYTAYLHEGYLKVWPQGALPDSTPLAAYTYTGAPVDPAAVTPVPPGTCRVIQFHQLQRIYQIQRYMATRTPGPRADQAR